MTDTPTNEERAPQTIRELALFCRIDARQDEAERWVAGFVAAEVERARLEERERLTKEFRDERIGRDRDIIYEAINEYNEWMLDDCFDALGCLQRIMDRMKDRVALGDTIRSDGGNGDG